MARGQAGLVINKLSFAEAKANVWCIGKLSHVLPATKDVATAMETNLTVNMGGIYTFAPSFQRDETLQVSAKLIKMSQDLGPLVQSLVKGMMANRLRVSVLGVPMGSGDYIKSFLADNVERFIADIPALKQADRFQSVAQLRTLMSHPMAALSDSCRLPGPFGPGVCKLGHNNPTKPLLL